LRPVIIDTTQTRSSPAKPLSPLVLIYGFAIIIAIGTALLMLPFASNQASFTPFWDAFFTATSAVTVTGLVVRDTASHWSSFGQVVLALLIQLGGFGFMASSTILFLLIGRRITLRDRILLRDTVGANVLGGLVRLIRQILAVTLVIELIGAAILYALFVFYFDPLEALRQAIFHSISAFNNAGFSTLPAPGLMAFRTNFGILFAFVILITLGSVGFSLLADVAKVRRFSRFTLDSKIVLVTAIGLLVAGTLIVLATEFGNPATLGELSTPHKVLNAIFYSVSARTAGFATVPTGEMREHSLFFLSGLMFIGGASGSTAGGIKITTFAILVAAILSAVRGREHVEAFGREVPEGQVNKALAVASMSAIFIFLAAFALTLTEQAPFLDLLFETMSAFGTAGLSTGVTPVLGVPGKALVILIMFIGRLGPLTLALTLALREETGVYRFAQERVKIG